ncbi:hypothetical protein LTR70_008077 [Exophiala xenobiotica]|uniref:Uncharacterized protein n=1 Tax=Lithohypha guttulata TaxID=1690604 RepID=A0ABR0K3N0_9EURO|nr:hypothetical protein LTR24_007194 [Lithohypha guttulata]KAK5312634.1 hypothetical protein LTR70_008077 [Exophiala xenobiotica]
MVQTRSGGASEPLESLETPPKRTHTPSKLVPVSVPASTKRSRDESDDEANTSKRARTQNTTTASSKPDMLFMFPKKPGSEDEDEDLTLPPRSYAEQIRRERRAREIARRNNRLGVTPRRRKPVKTVGDNPFGIETFTEQEKAAQAAQQQSHEPSTERQEREERSAAPEPETPRRGLFGSLRDLGSGVFGRIASPFSRTSPQARTEPRRRPVRVWDIQYPEIEPLQDETPAPAADDEGEEEETESEKKRKAFEAKYGQTDRRYDHLHTVPVDGNPDHLAYPPKKRVEVTKPSHESLPPAARAAHEQRRQRRERLHGKPPAHEPPAVAPLFGPNSHHARGTKNPLYEQHFTPGPHPAFRKFPGDKRSYHEAVSPEHSTSRTFQPFVEDDQDSAEQEPSTPAPKRQKTNQSIPQTPRSALKAPGSIGRTGRSARFNDNPIMSVKRMSPIYGSSPAGEYPYNPNNLFHTLTDDMLHSQQQKETGDDSTILSDPSPRTQYNTRLNEKVYHPGDRLTEAINAVGPIKPVQYVWRDPNNPDWKPSLANPSPGCFRVPDDEDDEEDEEGSPAPEAETPPPPSTPRMSHAELPKTSSTPQSAGALETANLERRRAEAAKTKPRTSSRLAEVTSARSRSPSPPGLDTDEAVEGEMSDSSIKTPSPTLDNATAPVNVTWTWSAETNEYISSNGAYPDFAYNSANELVPSFSLKTPSGSYDNTLTGPDNMTEAQRQAHYAEKYDDDWAAEAFPFDEPQTYEEAGVGSKYIHDLIRKNDARHPEVVAQCDERFGVEWDAHQSAIEAAEKKGMRLVATYPDRDGVEMLDMEEEEL